MGESVGKRVEAVKAFYRALSLDSAARLPAIYHPQVVFTDPAGSLRGLARLQRHFENLLCGTRQCAFAFADERQLIDGRGAALFWRMTIAAPRLCGGRAFTIDGASYLQFQPEGDLIILHRDYFDLGALLYERVPLLGVLVRRLRQRLAAAA